MCNQQETSGPQTPANSATVRLATRYWGIFIHTIRITSLRWPHIWSGRCLKCPIHLAEFCLRSNVCQSIFCRLYFWKADWQYWWSPHSSFSSKVRASVDRQIYLEFWCSLYTLVLANHKCLQPANKNGLLHASNLRRRFRHATDNPHWHHATHSLYSSADLVLFLTITFKHPLMNYSARAVLLTKYYSGDQIETMIWAGGACNTYGGQKRCIQNFGGET